MTDSVAPEDASPPAPVARPAVGRRARLLGQLKRFRGPIAAIAAFGAVLSGFIGYWSAYQMVENVVVPKPAPIAATADAGPLSIVVLPFQNLTDQVCQTSCRCPNLQLPRNRPGASPSRLLAPQAVTDSAPTQTPLPDLPGWSSRRSPRHIRLRMALRARSF